MHFCRWQGDLQIDAALGIKGLEDNISRSMQGCRGRWPCPEGGQSRGLPGDGICPCKPAERRSDTEPQQGA